MNQRPDLSIIVPTLNNEKLIPQFLKTISNQDFPKDKVEILFVDGGSTDKTLELAKENNIRVIKNPYVLAEPAIAIGMKETNGELLMILATDNYYADPHAFSVIVSIFQNKQIYAAFPKHDNKPSYNIFTKYHNVFTDPFNHFVYGYAANARTFHKIYPTLEHNKIFDIYDYSKNNEKPMIALAQGLTIRSSYTRAETDAFDDCKPVIDLIEQHKKIAYVHSISIYHETTRNLKHFIRKQRWATQNVLERKNYGFGYRFDKLSSSQKKHAMIWPLYALSFIFPLLRGIYGAIADREPLWLLHPLMCFFSAYASVTQLLVYNVKKQTSISRQV